MENPLAIVMTKVPGVVAVKTRLRQILSVEQCGTIATCFLLDTVSGLEDNFKNIVIAFTPQDGRKSLETILGERHKLTVQNGGDLGQRLTAVIAEAFESGFGPVIVVGTDSPTLPPEYLLQALDHLHKHNNGLTIGPTEDGGYYLIGMSKPHAPIFDNISWSTDRVFDQTLANIRKVGGLELQILPSWYDVDEPDDVRRLQKELESGESKRGTTSMTNRWFSEHRIDFDLNSDLGQESRCPTVKMG